MSQREKTKLKTSEPELKKTVTLKLIICNRIIFVAVLVDLRIFYEFVKFYNFIIF